MDELVVYGAPTQSAAQPRRVIPESWMFALILVAVIVVIYIMTVGLKETFYGRWRHNQCMCTSVMCSCTDDAESALLYASPHA